MPKTSKEIILERIRKGLSKAQFRTDLQESEDKNQIFVRTNKSLLEMFRDELTKINGEYYYFEKEEDLAEHLKNEADIQPVYCSDSKIIPLLEKAGIKYSTEFDAQNIKTGISTCEYLVARFGSAMVSSAIPGARKVFAYPHTHIVIAYENQLVLELEEALDGLQQKYGEQLPSQIINITGPSRTADIEKTLILGAHGPKRFVVFVLKS